MSASSPPAPADEEHLTRGLLRREGALSRNRNFELFASDAGRRAQRRARWLRALARELERLRDARGTLTITPEAEALVLRYHYRRASREARLSPLDQALLREAFPRLRELLELRSSPPTEPA